MVDTNGTISDLPRTVPGHLGIVLTHVSGTRVIAEIEVTSQHMAANGFLRAGAVVTLADTAAGYGCSVSLPAGASSFTTIELKSNHVGTAREGTIECVATPVHQGRTTQVWDAIVTHVQSGRTIAVFRCTQMILYRNRTFAQTTDHSVADAS